MSPKSSVSIIKKGFEKILPTKINNLILTRGKTIYCPSLVTPPAHSTQANPTAFLSRYCQHDKCFGKDYVNRNMTSLRPFHATDVFNFNPTNLDPLTETYDLNFYFSYLAHWPHLFTVATSPDETISAYVMGKLESSPAYAINSPNYLPFHAHITALTVAPHSRRLGLARTLSSSLETAGDSYHAWFVDLFVRKSNVIAQALYRGLGYSIYRTVKEYYHDDVMENSRDGEDAYDMRKPLKRDKDRKHIRKNGENFIVVPEDVW